MFKIRWQKAVERSFGIFLSNRICWKWPKNVFQLFLVCQRPGWGTGEGQSIFGRWQLWARGLNWWHVWKLCGMPIFPVRSGRRQRNTMIMKCLWVFEEHHIHNGILTPDRRTCSRWPSCSWWWGESASLKIFSRKCKGFHRCQLDDVI